MQKRRIRANHTSELDRLNEELQQALERAEEWAFDAPSPPALERVEELFVALAEAGVRAECVEVNIGVDGAIAVARSNGVRAVTVEFHPESGATEMVVSDEVEHRLLVSDREPSTSTIVSEIERAA